MEKNENDKILFKVNNLTHSFGGLRAVDDFNLSVKTGEIWGILGPNGAGKTTAFNLVTGVYNPDSGNVILAHEEINGLPSHEIISKGIARTFQNIRLFASMSVLDNVRTAGYCRLRYPLTSALFRTARFRREEDGLLRSAREILEKFGLAGRMHESASSLSYGLQRKIEMARALMSGPVLLLLDEPGAGMNPAELDDLAELILWMRKEFALTIILIEHRMRLVMKLCEYVKVLNFGKTIFTGTLPELAECEAVAKAYFGEGHADAFD